MSNAILKVLGPGIDREIELDRDGVVIGRGSGCDVALNDPYVSTAHARIYQDPFGRWLVEDLDSKNGVRIDGQRIDARAVLPGEDICIGPFTLQLVDQDIRTVYPSYGPTDATTFIMDVAQTEMVHGADGAEEILSVGRIRKLNELAERLSLITDVSRLYTALCDGLVDSADSAAMVLTVPPGDHPLPDSPCVLASRIGGRQGGAGVMGMHVSRRALDSVRRGGGAVLARNGPLDDQEMNLTVVDTRRPRTVVCAPIDTTPEAVEVLYLDIPSDRAEREVLDFIQAVTRLARLLRRSLVLAAIKAERRVLDSQLELAQEIQTGLLPRAISLDAGADMAWHYQPAMWVGGDFCDVWRLTDGRLAFAVGDVAGKGLAAAMIMTTLHACMRATTLSCLTPSVVMDHVNAYLNFHLPDGMFVTLVLGFFDPASGSLEYVNAGHIAPLVFGPDGEVTPLGEVRNLVLGPEGTSYEAEVLDLACGEGLIVVTDGITEAKSPDGDMLGDEALQRVVTAADRTSSRRLVDSVVRAASDFRRTLHQQDDVTALALIRAGGAC